MPQNIQLYVPTEIDEFSIQQNTQIDKKIRNNYPRKTIFIETKKKKKIQREQNTSITTGKRFYIYHFFSISQISFEEKKMKIYLNNKNPY